MDNASKALVMAGAILIAVMLISLGVLLFNRAQDIANNATGGVNASLVQAYNSRYTAYEGKNKGASQTRNLIHMVEAHNKNTEEVGQYGQITFSGNYSTAGAISDSKYYTIGVTIGGGNGTNASVGSVSSITISQQANYVNN